MRRILALLLTVVMALSLVVVASATTTRGKVELKVEETNRTTAEVTYTVTLVAGENRVAALQFELKPGSGMTLKERQLTDFATEFNLKAVEQNKKGSYGYFPESGRYIAYGGDATTNGRYLTGTQTIMTVTYSISESAAVSLTVPEFKACKDGSQAMNDPYECVRPQPAGLLGDVNGDGEVNIGDHQRLFEHLQGINPITDPNLLRAADTNSDNIVNIGDHQRLFEILQGVDLYS